MTCDKHKRAHRGALRDWTLVEKVRASFTNTWFTNIQEKNVVINKNIVTWARPIVSGTEKCSIYVEQIR